MKITDLTKHEKIKIGSKTYPIHSWNKQQIQDFWEFEGHREADFFGNQFNNQIAKKIYEHTSKTAFVPDQIIDIGCGTGKLLENLKNYFPTTHLIGIEPSPILSNNANRCYEQRNSIHEVTFKQRTLFILTEVIEHITEEELKIYLSDFKDRTSGETHIFLSCPNDEDLSKSFLINPYDSSIYHRYQHIQSYSKTRLENIIKLFHPREIRFQELNFNILSAHLIRRLRIALSIRIRWLLGQDRKTSMPHLITYIRI